MVATPQPLTEAKKEAYRHLLYVAMLDIRRRCDDTGPILHNPWKWRQRYLESRAAGAIADWLHNLALFSRDDFSSFSEEQFWKTHKWCMERFPRHRIERYREIFDGYLDGVYYTC